MRPSPLMKRNIAPITIRKMTTDITKKQSTKIYFSTSRGKRSLFSDLFWWNKKSDRNINHYEKSLEHVLLSWVGIFNAWKVFSEKRILSESVFSQHSIVQHKTSDFQSCETLSGSSASFLKASGVGEGIARWTSPWLQAWSPRYEVYNGQSSKTKPHKMFSVGPKVEIVTIDHFTCTPFSIPPRMYQDERLATLCGHVHVDESCLQTFVDSSRARTGKREQWNVWLQKALINVEEQTRRNVPSVLLDRKKSL